MNLLCVFVYGSTISYDKITKTSCVQVFSKMETPEEIESFVPNSKDSDHKTENGQSTVN